jgi:hypothetical protein
MSAAFVSPLPFDAACVRVYFEELRRQFDFNVDRRTFPQYERSFLLGKEALVWIAKRKAYTEDDVRKPYLDDYYWCGVNDDMRAAVAEFSLAELTYSLHWARGHRLRVVRLQEEFDKIVADFPAHTRTSLGVRLAHVKSAIAEFYWIDEAARGELTALYERGAERVRGMIESKTEWAEQVVQEAKEGRCVGAIDMHNAFVFLCGKRAVSAMTTKAIAKYWENAGSAKYRGFQLIEIHRKAIGEC